jgi:myo-inositol-1(or 4)-monophosphatase
MLQQIVKEISNNLDNIKALRGDYKLKHDNSYVSKGDLLVNSIVLKSCTLFLPEFDIITEEIDDFDSRVWDETGNYVIVDPIDGTENFVSGLKEWGVGISVYTKGMHTASCIFLPELNESLITGQSLVKYKSRIVGLSSSLTRNDLIRLPEMDFEYRIIGCSMYNMLSTIKGSFARFENVKGVNCWDILPGLTLALEHGLTCLVDDQPYYGQLLFPTQKYRIKLINQYQ